MSTRCPRCATPLAQDARFCGACGASLVGTSNEVNENRVITGRYRIEQKLGEGGMGAVFRAQQISLKRTIALKLLRSELSADAELVRRFNAEAELAAKLNHPNTVTLYDYGQDEDGTLFIAMEYIEGRSLRQLLAEGGAMPAGRAVAILEQVCDSLADAHAHGIVHRDLKPDNVMLSERGKKRDIVRVLDFGIAKLRDQRGDITGMPVTQAGSLLGTPQYMAPEQIRGDTVDGRADIYALGIMLYEMVTGALPFNAPSLMAMLSMHLMDAPVPPSQRCPGVVAPDMEHLIMSMLAKNPAERPPTMEAVAARLAGMRAQGAGYHASVPGHGQAPGHVVTPGGFPGAAPAFTPAPVSTPAPMSMSMPTSTAPPGAMPMPSPAVTPMPTMPGTRRKRRTGLWLGLLGLVLVGGAVAGFLLLRAGDKGEDKPKAGNSQPVETPPVSTDFYVPPTRDIFADD